MSELFKIKEDGSLSYTTRGIALYQEVFYKAGIDISEIHTLQDHCTACTISNVDTVLNDQFQNRHVNPATGKPTLLAEAINELLAGNGSAERFIELSQEWIKRASKFRVVK